MSLLRRLIVKSGRGLSILNGIALSFLRLPDFDSTMPIFIIGPPRSGTTLLYQVMINSLDVAYFNNLSAAFAEAPAVGFWLSERFGRQVQHDYQSSFGRTSGWWGPHEAGRFWYRWFPSGMHVFVPSSELPAESVKELRREIQGIVSITGRQPVFKNTYNSVRVGPLAKAFPNAVFIQMLRDPVDIAQSILNSRVIVNNDKTQWWSLPPKEIDEIVDKPYLEQIVAQVFYVYRQIAADKQGSDASRFFDVSYQDLCQAPETTIEMIRIGLSELGVKVSRKGEPPGGFPFSTGKKVSDDEYLELQRLTEVYWAGQPS